MKEHIHTILITPRKLVLQPTAEIIYISTGENINSYTWTAGKSQV